MKLSNIPTVYGICIGLTMIVYFLVLSIFGLQKYPVYSAFNIVIMGTGLFLLISKYKKETPGIFKYQKGFWAMFRAGMIATFIITGFFALYITELNQGFLRELLTTWKEDYDLKPGLAIFGLALMGFSTSLVFSLTHMQLFKRSWNTKKAKDYTL